MLNNGPKRDGTSIAARTRCQRTVDSAMARTEHATPPISHRMVASSHFGTSDSRSTLRSSTARMPTLAAIRSGGIHRLKRSRRGRGGGSAVASSTSIPPTLQVVSRWALAVAPAVGLAVLGGCGGSAPAAWRGNPVSVVRSAANRTIAAGTARVAVTLAQDTAGTGLSGTGLVDFAGDRASLSVGRTGAAAARDDRFTVV